MFLDIRLNVACALMSIKPRHILNCDIVLINEQRFYLCHIGI